MKPPGRWAPRERPGLVLLPLAAVAVAVNLWMAAGVVAAVEWEPVEYIFVSASFATFARLALLSLAAVALLHALVRVVFRTGRPPLFSGEDVAYATPLLLCGGALLALVTLAPHMENAASVLLFVVQDLRWWWTALILFWVLARLDRRSGGALRSVLRKTAARAPRWTPEIALAIVAAVTVFESTPALRYWSPKSGDEPKYVRYCEAFYQGLGFELSTIKPIDALGPDYRPHVLRNFALIGAALPGELRSLAGDALTLAHGRWPVGPAPQHEHGDFLIGKNGGLFEIHNPGLSILMFPAYYLDRRFGDDQADPGAQWPNKLLFLNAFLLGLYVAWTVLLFRFLRRCTESVWAPWVATVAGMLTLPIAAFPFQVYPEVAAGLLLLVVLYAVAFRNPAWRWRWFAIGVVLGYLPWVHVRFIGVTGVVALGAIVLLRGQRANVLRFAAGVALPLVCLALYTYRVTGSLLPTSTYFTDASSEPLSISGAIVGSLGYLIDRDWGLLAHSPVYLFALPGYYWLARRRPQIAAMTGAATVTLIGTAAAHSLVGAGTTPMRFIVAVVPLMTIPLALVLERAGRGRVFQAGFGLALGLSLENAVAYNLHHLKAWLIDTSASGWKVNLLFPADSRYLWNTPPANAALIALWTLAIVLLLGGPYVVERRRAGGWTPPPWRWRQGARPALALVAVAILIGGGTVVSASTGAWKEGHYLVRPEAAALDAARLIDEEGHCAICLSSRLGSIGSASMLTDLESVDPSVARRQRPGVVVPPYDEWLAMPGRIHDWYVEANGHDPADTDVGHYLYQWREEHATPAQIEARIFAAAGKPVPAADLRP